MADLMRSLSRGDVILFDGAMGTELERRGVPMDEAAWSALALDSHPEVVRAIHRDYVEAGARIHLTHSFAAARHVLDLAGHGARTVDFNRTAVSLVKESLAAAGKAGPFWIGGSVSSYAKGSDRGNLPSAERLRANLQEQVGLLHDGGVDLFVLEMLYDVEIARLAVEAAAATGLPVMIGFTCLWDETGSRVETLSREVAADRAALSLEEVLRDVVAGLPDGLPAIVAIMHSEIDVTTAALDVVARLWDGPVAAYPNSGGYEPPHWQFDTVCAPGVFAEQAERWVDRGVQIVGGCCGIGPDHIRAARDRLADRLTAP